MTYKLTTKVLELVEQLIEEGYGGNATLSRCGCTGTQGVMSENGCKLWIELSGFTKETLNLAEDTETGDIVAVGRYSHKGVVETVEDIVGKAWEMFTSYESRGFSMPYEFKDLFEKYGYIEEKEVLVKKTKVTRLK